MMRTVLLCRKSIESFLLGKKLKDFRKLEPGAKLNLEPVELNKTLLTNGNGQMLYYRA